MIRFYILVLFCFISQLSIAQQTNGLIQQDLYGDPFNSSNQMMIRALNSFEKGISDNEYFALSDWSVMNAHGRDGQHITADSANVLINGGKVLFYRNGELLQLFGSVAKEVRIGDRIFLPYPSINKSLNGALEFYEVLVNEDFKLIKVWKVEEKPVSDNPMGIVHDSKTELVKSSKLYFVNRKGNLELVPSKKKDFAQIFGRDQKKMIEFAKAEKLNVKKDENVILLFQKYNRILDEK